MRGKTTGGKDIEALNVGFALAKGDDYVPPEVEKELEPKSAEDILSLTDLGDRLEDAVKVRNGWLYIMLRRKVGHGNFKNYLEAHHKPYKRAWDCMCYARAVQRFPGLAGLITGRAIRHVLALGAPEINQIEEQITGIPADEAKKISRSWIEKEYRKIQAEKDRGKKRKTNYADVTPTELDSLVAKAQSALLLIYDLKLSPDEYERAARYRDELQLCWDRASYTLRDPEHKTKPIFELHPMADDITEDD